MSVYRMRKAVLLITAIAASTVLAEAGDAQAAIPVKLTLTSQFGREVNLTQVKAKTGEVLEDVCTVASKDECQSGAESSLSGGFHLAESVAAAPSGDVYAVDLNSARVEEFSATGQFALMFGKEVNETTKEDVCTAAESTKCKAGVEGSAPGQLDRPYDIAVDPSGDIYVAEVIQAPGVFGERVQKFTPEGRFVLEIGKDVNENTGGNLCTHVEEEKGVKCTAPSLRESGVPYVPESGSFNFEIGAGDLLATGHEGSLYVGEEGRVQVFKETGEFSEEVTLEAGARVNALAVDTAGDLYVTVGSSSNVVREFVSKSQVKEFAVNPEEFGAEVTIHGLALDAEGHIAVAAGQQLGTNKSLFGSLYEASGGIRLTAFKIPTERAVKGISFGGNGDLYIATETSREILQYTPKPVAALATSAIAPCTSGAVRETDVTLNCTLEGEVEPEGVAQTEAWFEWGRGNGASCGLASLTPKQPVSVPGKVDASLEGLRPSETYCYQLVAEDENAKAPEALTTSTASFTTKLAAPQILGEPQAQFVKASSTVMAAKLNPENAQTRYYFEYAPGAKTLAQCDSILEGCDRSGCPGAAQTLQGQSGVYGSIGVTSEAVGLRPGTEYSYRLFAESENASSERCATTSGEGSFTTAIVPSPSAVTGGYGAVGATNAIVSATVTPDGAPVTYSFELGVFEGAATQFGVVSSGSVEPDGGPVEVLLPLTGLQPGTTYAYRIAISSGYIDNQTQTLQGRYETFTTNGLPAVLQPPAVLAQLPAPPIAFPKAAGKPRAKTKGKAKKKTKRRGKAKTGKKAHRSSARRRR